MTAPTSSRHCEEFTPDYYDLPEYWPADKARPVFVIKALTRDEESQMKSMMTMAGIPKYDHSREYPLLRAAIEALVVEGERPEMLDLVDKAQQMTKETQRLILTGAPLTDLDEALVLDAVELDHLTGLRQLALTEYAPYQTWKAAADRYIDRAPYYALHFALVGWRALVGDDGSQPVDLPTVKGRVPLEALDLLPDADVTTAGFRAMALMRPTPAQAKNSVSPSQSSTNRRASRARKPRTVAQAGKSAGSSTKKTPSAA